MHGNLLGFISKVARLNSTQSRRPSAFARCGPSTAGLAHVIARWIQPTSQQAGTAASFGRTELGSVAKEAEDSLADLTDTSMCTQASSSVDALLAELTATLLEKPAKAA